MYCIKCNSEMRKCYMYGVLLDFCDECKSIWVDGFEIDCIIYNIKYNYNHKFVFHQNPSIINQNVLCRQLSI